MKRATIPILLLAIPSFAGAGEIFGKVTAGEAAVGEGTGVSARCGETDYPAVTTDKSGNFHMVVAESGKCTLTVVYKDQSASLEVVSFDEGTQVDIALETKDGQLTARRR